jgi:flavin reductase (DIM6/NTAB) family NADH-FMN oxidoreductase RutF
MSKLDRDQSPESTLDPELVREVRRQWVSGVTVVLTREDDGFRGATVAAFAVVSLEPPTVLICLDRDGRMSELVPGVGQFTVSILDP